ncbi:MAG: hypothetical protein AAFR16_09605 [Pseudomonadota bacterium]
MRMIAFAALSAMALLIGCSKPAPVLREAAALVPAPPAWSLERQAALLAARQAECRPPPRRTVGALCRASTDLIELRLRNRCAILRARGERPLPQCDVTDRSSSP